MGKPIDSYHSTIYLSLMEKKFELQILREFANFINSEEGKSLSKQKNKLGGRIRYYTSKFKDDKLTPRAALAVMLDAQVIKHIEFIEFKKVQ